MPFLVFLTIINKEVNMKGQNFYFHNAIQALFYIQSKSNITDKLSLLKILFFADRYHIRNYGIPLLQDNYFAMKLGPVCSKTYDLIKKGLYYDGLNDADRIFIDSNLFCNNDIVSIKDTGMENLSESDFEALNFYVDTFSKFTPYELSDITHEYPEWKKFKDLFDNQISTSENMNYCDFFDNPSENSPIIKKFFNGKDPFYDDELFLKAMKQEYYSSI